MVRLALVLTVLALTLGGCNTAYNYFEEESDASEQGGDSTAFGAILSMTGMVEEKKRPIQYKPRAPLAIPGSTDLPTPEETSAAEAAVNFPVDQDERIRQRQAELDARGAEAAYERNAVGEIGVARVGPDGVAAARRAGGGLDHKKDYLLEDSRPQDFRLTREQMRQTFTGRSQERALLTEDGKPAPRAYLIQPPADYRTPADSAALPDKGDIENSEWAEKRLYGVNDRRPPRAQK
ncbi:hypothetical protein L1787_00485 [Acuticoccus sp. M5D2P5]|uniref:hypothetical protein n=1 Tax=Acuticoccus kalidii TaxID=2910977 RepID=UPI001F40963E|nr:hypothetical protein [Acuticoccus kalidii]MCF3931886.1 hypothetical protein [Acuticoccus kalidii]